MRGLVSRPPGLLSRDLAALSAFGAVALSGVLPLPVLIIFPIVFVLSLLGVRPLAGRRTVSVIVLLVIGVGLFAAVALSTLDLVIAAVSFATLVTSHRMLAEPTPQASRQVLLSGLLLVSGGAALTGEALFALLLTTFFLTASWSLAWLVLARDEAVLAGGERQAVSRQLVVGSLTTLLLGVGFFVVFPRLSWNLANRRGSPGLGGVTGMSDTVKLGGGGDIKTSVRVAFRAELTPNPGVDELRAYWVGRHFDSFDGSEWTSSQRPLTPAGTVVLHRASRRSLGQLSQDIELTPAYGSRTLVAIDTPTFFARGRGVSVAGTQPMPLVHVPGDQVFGANEANTTTYMATSDGAAGVDQTEPSPAASGLPAGLDPRVAPLADELARGATTPLAIARQLEQELKRRYDYTLDLPGDVADPLADFLFVRRAGHCEDFATALSLMLRLKGIPSRLTTGFFGGERAGARYVVRAGDAHAWAEAYVDGAWVRLDATPDQGRAASGGRWAALVAQSWEQLEDWWRSRVVDYSFQDQLSFVRSLARPPAIAQTQSSTLSLPDGSAPRAVLVATGLAMLGVGVWLASRRRQASHPAADFLAEIERRLEARGLDVRSQPLEELSHQLSLAQHPLSQPLAQACRRYLEARFAGRPLTPAERSTLLAGLETPRR
ncbi:MAG: DUF3488 domain-containing protein [Myxococcaceae bacterium]|nr:DUF3488 domain-containing protein [Myxococcaceae bacterium]